MLKRIVGTAIVAAGFFLGATLPSEAFPAIIAGDEPGTDVTVRVEPSQDSEELDYGRVGDSVDILDEAIGSDGYTWYYVELIGLGTVGWIRGDYIVLEDATLTEEGLYYELSEDTWDDSEEVW